MTPQFQPAPAVSEVADRHRRMKIDPSCRILRIVLLLGLILVAVLPILLRKLGVEIGRPVGFRLVMLFIVLCNLLWWTLADVAIIRLTAGRDRLRIMARALLVVGMAVILGPVLAMLVRGRTPSFAETPVYYVSYFQLWHMALVLFVPAMAAISISFYGVWRLACSVWRRAGLTGAVGRSPVTQPDPNDDPATPVVGPTRRDCLKAACIYAPTVLVGAVSLQGGRHMGRFDVNKHDLPAPWLPDRLRGLTITHVSDLHLGRLYRPAMLPRLVDAVNRLKSDLIVVTGDVVDMSNDMLPPAVAALRQFEARYGLFLCIGNHDLIDDGDVFIQTLRGNRLDLLVNERKRVFIEGETISVAGLGWAGGRAARDGVDHDQLVARTLRDHRPDRDGPVIALAHHPHAFDHLAPAGVSLTLSGHTHGGQLMFTPPRSDGQGDPSRDQGIGRMLFHYLRGFYHQNGSTLFVNSGVGNWFPIRLNAPAEIARIRLV